MWVWFCTVLLILSLESDGLLNHDPYARDSCSNVLLSHGPFTWVWCSTVLLNNDPFMWVWCANILLNHDLFMQVWCSNVLQNHGLSTCAWCSIVPTSKLQQILKFSNAIPFNDGLMIHFIHMAFLFQWYTCILDLLTSNNVSNLYTQRYKNFTCENS